MMDLLIDKGAEVNSKGFSGDTPLHMAAMEDSNPGIAFLLGKGAEINKVNEFDDTPLHVAIKYKSAANAKLLIELGADVKSEDPEGTLLKLATENKMSEIMDLLNHKVASGKLNRKMIKASLKNRISEKISAKADSADIGYDLNMRFAGAQFNLELLRQGAWRVSEPNDYCSGVYADRSFNGSDDKTVEFRIYFSSLGHWRHVDISTISSEAGGRWIPAFCVESEILDEICAKFENSRTQDFPADVEGEMLCVVGQIDVSRIPAGITEEACLAVLWYKNLLKLSDTDKFRSRRIVNGAVRHVHFCSSGLVTVKASHVASNLGMMKESAILLRRALGQEADNTAEYWDLLGGVTCSLGQPEEAFECCMLAVGMGGVGKRFCKDLWRAGKILISQKMKERNFHDIHGLVQSVLSSSSDTPPKEKSDCFCALGLAYEGQGELEKAASYYKMALKTIHDEGQDIRDDDFEKIRTPVALFSLGRLRDSDVARRKLSFENQLQCFPLTPSEAGHGGKAPVRYIQGINHSLFHWGAVVKDARDFFEGKFKDLFLAADLEGEKAYAPDTVGFGNFDLGVGYKYTEPGTPPTGLMVFIINGRPLNGEQLNICASFPVFIKGGLAEMTMNRAYEWESGLEGNVNMSFDKEEGLDMFVPDYYRDRHCFERGCRYVVELAGIVISMFDKSDAERAKSARLPVDNDKSFLFGTSEGVHANCQYYGEIIEVETSSFFGNTVYRVILEFNTGSSGVLHLPVFIGAHMLHGFVPRPGVKAGGVFWLQGILRKKV